MRRDTSIRRQLPPTVLVYERGDTTEGTVCECRLQEFKKAAWLLNASRSHAFYHFFPLSSFFSLLFLFPFAFLSFSFSFLFFFFLLLFFFFFFARGSGDDGPENREGARSQGQNERKRSGAKKSVICWSGAKRELPLSSPRCHLRPNAVRQAY